MCGTIRKTGVGALAMVMSLMLIVVVAACTHSSGSDEDGVEWSGFFVSVEQSALEPIITIEEMERIGGFTFVFPSYLPDSTGGRMTLQAWAGTTTTTNGVLEEWGPGERVMIYPTRSDAPYITITEQMKPFSSIFPDSSGGVEDAVVANTNVGCKARTVGEFGQVLECEWVVGEQRFGVFIQWTNSGRITKEMRQEAMKVIKSMIVAPDHP